MSAIRFQRMLDIPGVLPKDVPFEHDSYVTVFITNKKQSTYSVEDNDFNKNSIT